jgi:anti-sigma factor RsiW
MSEHEHCQDMLGSLSDYVDGTLKAEICAEIERHLVGCTNCRVVVNTLRKTIELYQQDGELAAELPMHVRERLFFRLDLAEFLKKE